MKTIRKRVGGSALTPPRTELRILVTGARDWSSDEDGYIWDVLDAFLQEQGFATRRQDVLLIQGGAEGVDLAAKGWAVMRGVACAQYDAPWRKMHKTAGPVRNGWMLRWGVPHAVLAFHKYLPNSRGTKNMIELARKAGVPLIRIYPQ